MPVEHYRQYALMPVKKLSFPRKTQGEGILADKTACVCFKPGVLQ